MITGDILKSAVPASSDPSDTVTATSSTASIQEDTTATTVASQTDGKKVQYHATMIVLGSIAFLIFGNSILKEARVA